jgi:hypothetical protein
MSKVNDDKAIILYQDKFIERWNFCEIPKPIFLTRQQALSCDIYNSAINLPTTETKLVPLNFWFSEKPQLCIPVVAMPSNMLRRYYDILDGDDDNGDDEDNGDDDGDGDEDDDDDDVVSDYETNTSGGPNLIINNLLLENTAHDSSSDYS